jgi:hypothetical protein
MRNHSLTASLMTGESRKQIAIGGRCRLGFAHLYD